MIKSPLKEKGKWSLKETCIREMNQNMDTAGAKGYGLDALRLHKWQKSPLKKIWKGTLKRDLYMWKIYQDTAAAKGCCLDALHLHKWEKSLFTEIWKVTLKRDLYMWEIYQDMDMAGAKGYCLDALRLGKWIKSPFSSVRFAGLKLARLSPTKWHARILCKKR